MNYHSMIETSQKFENSLNENIRTQLALLALRLKFKENERLQAPRSKGDFIRYKIYKKLNVIKTFVLVFYAFFLIFDKPMWCYNKLDETQEIMYNDCNPNVAVLVTPINVKLFRSVEIFILVFLLVFKVEFNNKLRVPSKTNTIRTVILVMFTIVMIFDSVVSMILHNFAYANFILRPFIFILMSRDLREEWMRVLKVLYYTKKIFFLFGSTWLLFSALGFYLFSSSDHLTEEQVRQNEFNTLESSFRNMFYLLTSSRFPELMLRQIDYGRKFSIPFFVVYLIIIMYLIMGLVKAQYYWIYLELNKNKINAFLKNFLNEENINRRRSLVEHKKKTKRFFSKPKEKGDDSSESFYLDQMRDSLSKSLPEIEFNLLENQPNRRFTNSMLEKDNNSSTSSDMEEEYIAELSNRFSLTKEEKTKFQSLLERENPMLSKIFEQSSHKVYSERKYFEKKENSNYYIRILRKKRVELMVNLINISLITLNFLFRDSSIVRVLEYITSLYFLLVEFLLFLRIYGFKKFIEIRFVYTLFYAIVFVGLLVQVLVFLMMLLKNSIYIYTMERLIDVLFTLRFLRIFVFLNMFAEYKYIFITLHNMKSIFYSLLLTQYSFFLIFATATMFLIGGKIERGQFDDIDDIPNYYYYINFNNYASCFIACLSMMIMVNIDVVMSMVVVSSEYLSLYFCIFYLIAVNLILNICHTYILDMYLNIKNTYIKIESEEEPGDRDNMDPLLLKTIE